MKHCNHSICFEQVRKALFDMLMSFAGGDPGHLGGTRWLDLFAGTGSVGLEALSRGAAHCHFIELDSWVISNVLSPNIEECHMASSTLIYSGKAETFLQRARDAPQFASKPFDYLRWGPFGRFGTPLNDILLVHSAVCIRRDSSV